MDPFFTSIGFLHKRQHPRSHTTTSCSTQQHVKNMLLCRLLTGGCFFRNHLFCCSASASILLLPHLLPVPLPLNRFLAQLFLYLFHHSPPREKSVQGLGTLFPASDDDSRGLVVQKHGIRGLVQLLPSSSRGTGKPFFQVLLPNAQQAHLLLEFFQLLRANRKRHHGSTFRQCASRLVRTCD